MNPDRHIPDAARTPAPPGRWRASTLTAVLAATAAFSIAGCGGSSATTTTTATGAGGVRTISPNAAASSGGSPDSPSSQAKTLQFSKCMRTHGVTGFPDPGSHGQLTIKGTGIDTNSPAFRSASKTCQPLIGGGVGSPSAQRSDLPVAQQLALARCMRAHGVPNFPDPNGSGTAPAARVNLNSPQVLRAFHTCQPASRSSAPQTP
jgi:hypothetical protein